MTFLRYRILWIFPILFSLGGCNETATGDLSGRIILQGKPLPWGNICFLCNNGQVKSSTIEDGSYRIVGLSTGPARITIFANPASTTPVPPDQRTKHTSHSQTNKSFIPVPARYKNAKSSGLVCNVVSGPQTYDIELTP